MVERVESLPVIKRVKPVQENIREGDVILTLEVETDKGPRLLRWHYQHFFTPANTLFLQAFSLASSHSTMCFGSSTITARAPWSYFSYCRAAPFAHRRMARRRTLRNDGHKQKNSKDHEMHNALKDGRPTGAQCDHAHQQRESEEHDFFCVQPQGELLSK